MDGGEIHRNAEHYVFSWQSGVAEGDVWDIKFVMLLVKHCMVRKSATRRRAFKEIVRFIIWVLEVWSKGRLPSHGFYGEGFTKGKRAEWAGSDIAYAGAYAGMKSDGKAKVQLHWFRRFYNATFICEECYACNSFPHAPVQLFFGDFADNALYTTTIINYTDYLDNEIELSPWVDVPGFHFKNNYRDLMHNLWIGNGRDASASCCCEFVELGLLGPGDPDDLLGDLSLKLSLWCKRNKISKVRHKLSLRAIGRPDRNTYPELASYFKAVNTKVLCMFLAEEAEHLDGGSERDNHRTACMWSLAEFTHVLDHAERFLTDEEIARAQRAGKLYLLSYAWLAKHAEEQNEYLWKLRPKMHYIWHTIADLSARLNPKRIQCDDDETYMHTMKRIGSHCHGATVHLRGLQRYLLGLSVRFNLRIRRHCWNSKALGL